MTWFIFTIISPVLNALVNHIDKYLLDKILKKQGIGSIMIFSSLMGLPVALAIPPFEHSVFNISFINILLLLVNGGFYVAWMLPYFYALDKSDASTVAPLFQLSSVLSLFLGYFILGEALTIIQVIGCVLIMVGGLGLSLETDLRSVTRLKSEVLVLMGISCAFIGLGGVVFKLVALEESFWVASFWENIGIFLSSLFLLSVTSYRTNFIKVVKFNGLKTIGLVTTNELLVLIARITLNYAVLLAPVALVYFVSEGFQPFFVLAYGVFLTLFFPKFANEDLSKPTLIKKVVSMCIMFGGTYLISF